MLRHLPVLVQASASNGHVGRAECWRLPLGSSVYDAARYWRQYGSVGWLSDGEGRHASVQSIRTKAHGGAEWPMLRTNCYRVIAYWSVGGSHQYQGQSFLVCMGRSRDDCRWRLCEALDHLTAADADNIECALLQVVEPAQSRYRWHWQTCDNMTDDVLGAMQLNHIAEIR